MSPPSGSPATNPSRNLPANGATPYLSARVLQREAAKVVADLGIEVRPARIRLLVNRFLEDGRSDVRDERNVTDFRNWFITYADPTGETAVNNVMRERGTR